MCLQFALASKIDKQISYLTQRVVKNMAIIGRYNSHSWFSDAALLKAISDSVEDDEDDSEVKSMIKEKDLFTAEVVLQTLLPEKQEELLDIAAEQLIKGKSPAEETKAMQTFLDRFRSGPNHWSAPSESTATVIEISDNEEPNCRCDKKASSSDDDEFPESPEASDCDSDEDEDEEPYYPRERLESEDLKYDGTTSVQSYINRLKYLEVIYEEEEVLRRLDTAMTGAARVWFDGLDSSIRNRMGCDLQEWYRRLQNRFKIDPLVALMHADQMRHSFDDMSMDVRGYLEKKRELYRDAGENNQDFVVRRLYAGLDPRLAKLVTIKPYGNDMEAFTTEVCDAAATCEALQLREVGWSTGW